MRNFLTTSFVATLFFLSGGCGLVYESLWTRYLTELTGGTALSQLIVLMVFMGGLSLGAILVGRLVDQQRGRGLVVYGGLETGIGLYAIIFPLLQSKLAHFYFSVGANLGSGTAGLLGLKILLSFLLIIAPSVAMGGTLPAVSRYLTRSFEGLRGNIALLYGINSLGAVVGILAGGFFLVYYYGMTASMQYTGALNLAIGLAALAYARFVEPAQIDSATEYLSSDHCPEEMPDCLTYEPAEVRRAILTAGLTGFAAMALQVAWIRYYVIFLGATHSSFTIVVAAFIFGIGLGSLLVKTKIVGRIPLPQFLTGLLVFITTILWVQLFLYARLPFEISRLLGVIAPTPFAWPFYRGIKFGILFSMMLLPTLASGMVLPVCVRIAERGSEMIGRDVARVYAVNTISALLGILVTGQLLFRLLTLPRTLQVIMFIYLIITIFLVIAMKAKGRKAILAFITVLIFIHFAFWRPWSPVKLFVSQIVFGQTPPLHYERFIKIIESKIIIKELQGPDAQVTVVDGTDDNKSYRSMFINGKADAGTAADMPVQVLLGHLPVLLHPDPDNVFVLGLGSGITSGEILKYQDIQEVITAELAVEVFEASKTFADENSRFWENKRHRMVIEDGMTFLRLAKEKFDVIALEPSNVWQAGMAGLFSEDFFRIAKSRLKPGGIVAQWLHLYKADDLTVDLVLKTFSQVFPKSSIFMADEDNILLIGYDEQWKFDPQSLKERFYQPQILASQKKIGIVSPANLLMREVLDRDSYGEYSITLSLPINTLDFPVLEQAAEYSFFIKNPSTLLDELDSRLDPDGGNLLVHEYFRGNGLTPEQITVLIDSEHVRNNQKLRNSLVFMLLDKTWSRDQQAPPIKVYSYLDDAQLREIVTHPGYRKPPGQMTADEAYNLLGAELMIWYKAASQLWQPDRERLKQLYARVAGEADHETAARVARDAGVSLSYSGACREALPFFRFAVDAGNLGPEGLSPGELSVLFSCEVKEGDPEKALQWWQLIEENQLEVTPAMRRDKSILDIKLGGEPPPPFHGRLPDRW